MGIETLEERALPAAANYFVLDFTPDYHVGSFRDTFYNVKLTNGKAPSFLDFNKDGWITDTDVSIAAQQVANRVATFYAPFVNQAANHLSIQYGDVLTQNYWGFNSIKNGIANPNALVSVMYFGGTNSSGLHILGRAPEAFDGQNIEGYGETYTRTIAMSMSPYATSAQFVDKVAATAAHELGHMMGLRHAKYNASNLMSDTISNNPGATYFVNGWQYTDGGPNQHAYWELAYSFQTNQKQVPAPNYSLGGQWLQDGDDHGHDHMTGCSCGGHHTSDPMPDLGNVGPAVFAPEAIREREASAKNSVRTKEAAAMPPLALAPTKAEPATLTSSTSTLSVKPPADSSDPLGRWSGVSVK